MKKRRKAGTKTEEALRVSLVKYQTLFDCFPMGITVSDSVGKLLESNAMAEELLGLSQQQKSRRMINGEGWRIVRPDGTPMPVAEYASVRALKENRRVEDVEMGLVKARGKITWISVTAAPLPLEGHGVVIVYGDITERKRAETRLMLLSRELMAVREDEKKRVAAGLHHDVGSLAVGLSAHLDAIEADVRSGKPGEVLRWTSRARKLLSESVVRLKAVAIELRPPELDVLGLCAALRHHFTQIQIS